MRKGIIIYLEAQMKLIKALIIIVSLLIFAGGLVDRLGAQTTLAEAAKKEKERRAKTTKPSKTITNETLKTYLESKGDTPGTIKQPGEESETTDQSSGNVEGREDSDSGSFKGPTDLEGHDESYWRNRIKQYKDKIADLEKKAEELQTKMNGLNLSFGSIDDPNQRELLGIERLKTQQDLEHTNESLQKSKQELENLRDEGRQKGALPGWIYD